MHSDRSEFEPHLASTQSHEIHDVIHQAHQSFAAARDQVEVADGQFVPAAGQPFAQRISQANDSMERCFEFMGNSGQKVIL